MTFLQFYQDMSLCAYSLYNHAKLTLFPLGSYHDLNNYHYIGFKNIYTKISF